MSKADIVVKIIDGNDDDLELAAEVEFGIRAFDQYFTHVPEADMRRWFQDYLDDKASEE